MRRSTLLLAITGVLSCTGGHGALLGTRATSGHDTIEPFDEETSADNWGSLIIKHKPYLYVAHGCDPYAAVDAEGTISGGLRPTGSSSAGCSDSSRGQVYARTRETADQLSIMYSWYFPKDSPSTFLGHRHEWENVVVFLNKNKDYAVDGVAASKHGDYDGRKGNDLALKGESPKIKYDSDWPQNHFLEISNRLGAQQPVIDWPSMPRAARRALEDANFGKANVPFINKNFKSNIREAWRSLDS